MAGISRPAVVSPPTPARSAATRPCPSSHASAAERFTDVGGSLVGAIALVVILAWFLAHVV